MRPDDETEWITDYKENQCGNCHSKLGKNDKYCRYCGTKRGGGAFKPYQNLVECIYGPPPVKRSHRCLKCNYEWCSVSMIDKEKYCPKCGSDQVEEDVVIEK